MNANPNVNFSFDALVEIERLCLRWSWENAIGDFYASNKNAPVKLNAHKLKLLHKQSEQLTSLCNKTHLTTPHVAMFCFGQMFVDALTNHLEVTENCGRHSPIIASNVWTSVCNSYNHSNFLKLEDEYYNELLDSMTNFQGLIFNLRDAMRLTTLYFI